MQITQLTLSESPATHHVAGKNATTIPLLRGQHGTSERRAGSGDGQDGKAIQLLELPPAEAGSSLKLLCLEDGWQFPRCVHCVQGARGIDGTRTNGCPGGYACAGVASACLHFLQN